MEAAHTYGLPIQTTPEQALLDEVCRTAGHVAWLGEQVAALDPEALTFGVSREVTSEAGGGQLVQTAGLAAILKAYQAERAHLTRVCVAAIAAGIAERTVRLAEAQGALIADILRRTFSDPELGLTAEQRAIAARVSGGHLRAVSD